MYKGIYHGKTKHSCDLDKVIERAIKGGVKKIIVTGTCLNDSKEAIDICKKYGLTEGTLYSTVGCHPTRCNEFKNENGINSNDYYSDLLNLLSNEKVVALGEIGLDYDRTKFCSCETQKKYFEKQLQLFSESKKKIPLFLHCRNSFNDLYDILNRNRFCLQSGGVVHSFTGTLDEANKFIEMGLHIGINGCSMKTMDNVNVVEKLPIDKILMETDAPWCQVRPTHAGYKYIENMKLYDSSKKEKFQLGFGVKGRNEPTDIIHIAEIISKIKKIDVEKICDVVYENSCHLFNL